MSVGEGNDSFDGDGSGLEEFKNVHDQVGSMSEWA
jgi:hypothetical protein